jgi:hypothetical protein
MNGKGEGDGNVQWIFRQFAWWGKTSPVSLQTHKHRPFRPTDTEYHRVPRNQFDVYPETLDLSPTEHPQLLHRPTHSLTKVFQG